MNDEVLYKAKKHKKIDIHKSLFIIRISVSIKFTAKIKDILFFKYTPIIIPVT